MLIGILYTLLILCSLVLIFLVLIQRGKGGGLAGAFGGAGGSSAFGTKAGDVFTKVTMYVAGVWIAVSMLLVLFVNRGPTSAWGPSEGGSQQVPAKSSGAKSTGKPPSPTNGTRTGKSADVEAAPGDKSQAPSTAPSRAPAQPANPGDPLAPLPSAPKSP